MAQNGTLRLAILLGAALVARESFAATAPIASPSIVDPGRIDRRPETAPITPEPKTTIAPMKTPQQSAPPPGSSKIMFTLKSVTVDNMHAFTPDQVKDLYADYVGKRVSVDLLWQIAAKLTERYQAQGYFLSRVYVPAQEIAGGDIHLRAIEGYVSEIHLNGAAKDNSIAQDLLDDLRQQKPLTAKGLESTLLRLNDLPGVSVRAVLGLPDDKKAPEGATKLDLVANGKSTGNGKVSFDNNGSRYLGPYELSGQYQAEVIPGQKTTVSGLVSTPVDELQYVSLRHEVPLFAGATFEGFASYTGAYPGYTLDIQEIHSKSYAVGGTFKYQWIRQRDENLTTSIGLDSRDTRSTIIGTPLTRDAVRAARANATFDIIDDLQGYNQVIATVSQGIDGMGASNRGDAYLSRAEARPDFTKAELVVSRLQSLGSDFNLFGAVSGQIASGPLFSSEEFGYGGQVFGRAYDASEITGDQGVAGAIELRYTGVDKIADFFTPVPYVFYDIGTVWNFDSTQADRASGSSAGAGFRMQTDIGVSTNLGLAFPLTRAVSTPLPGNNGKNPRLLLEVSYDF